MHFIDRIDPFASEEPTPEGVPRSRGLGTRPYADLFSVAEIEQSSLVRALYVALLIGFYATFDQVSPTRARTIGPAVPWPSFTSALWTWVPMGPHAQGIFHIGLITLTVLAAFAVMARRWELGQLILLVLFVVKGWFIVVRADLWADCHLLHMMCAAIFVFGEDRLYWIRRFLVLFYVLSGAAKLSSGWTAGTYFSAIQGGLIFVPDRIIPLASNLALLVQLVISYFLLSTNWTLQRVSLCAFVLFNLYAVAFAGFLFPMIALPLLLVCFCPRVVPAEHPRHWKSLVPVALLGMILLAQGASFLSPHDPYLTNIGSRFALKSFDANHQFIVSQTVTFKDGSTDKTYAAGYGANYKPEPALAYYQIKRLWCKKPNVVSVALQLDSSINGGPFYRVVDVPNMCSVAFHAFGANDWIKRSAEDAAVVGYPVKDEEDGARLLVEKEPFPTRLDAATGHLLIVPTPMATNAPMTVSPLQQGLLRHERMLRSAWIGLSLIALAYLLLSERKRAHARRARTSTPVAI